jgi:Ca-activated chloride channel homolog
MHWEQPIYFYGLLGAGFLLLLFILYLLHKKKVVAQLGDVTLIKQLTQNYKHQNFVIKNTVLLLSLFCLIFCVANLQGMGKSSSFTRNGMDIICVLDVSKSMLANDIAPNRLERAKNFLLNVQEAFPQNKYGLILFAGYAYMQMPLTSDISTTRLLLNNATPYTVPTQGTQIKEALDLCKTAFSNKDKKFKTVILISDGENHESDNGGIVKELSDSGIVVYTIGIGTATGASIMDPETNDFKKDAAGKTIVSKLEDTYLKEIAKTTNGKYYAFTNSGAVLTDLKKEFATMGIKRIQDKSFMNFTSYYYWFAIPALVLLCITFFITNYKKNV